MKIFLCLLWCITTIANVYFFFKTNNIIVFFLLKIINSNFQQRECS